MTPLKTRFKHWLGQYPALFFPTLKLMGNQTLLRLAYQQDTDIVIEGFPRSANTFSVVAFEQAQQNTQANIAHHLHTECQLIRAAKNGSPACALIREPAPAISSYILRHPEIEPDWALQRYIKFYENLLPYKDQIYFAEFNTVTSDFGQIIQGINQKFGTSFSVFKHSKKEQDDVFSSIESINKENFEGKETFIGRPSEERNKIYQEQHIRFDQTLLEHANTLYLQICSDVINQTD